MDRAVTLQNLLRRKAGPLEVPVDVAGEDEISLWTALAPAAEDLETGVRRRGAVEIEPVPEEAPCLFRISMEPVGVGDFLEAAAMEDRIGPPEALRPTEVRQATRSGDNRRAAEVE